MELKTHCPKLFVNAVNKCIFLASRAKGLCIITKVKTECILYVFVKKISLKIINAFVITESKKTETECVNAP